MADKCPRCGNELIRIKGNLYCSDCGEDLDQIEKEEEQKNKWAKERRERAYTQMLQRSSIYDSVEKEAKRVKSEHYTTEAERKSWFNFDKNSIDKKLKTLAGGVNHTQQFDKSGIGGRGNKIYFTDDKYRDIVKEAEHIIQKHVALEVRKIDKIHPLIQTDESYSELIDKHGASPVVEIQMTLTQNFTVQELNQIVDFFNRYGLTIFNSFGPVSIGNGDTFVAYTFFEKLHVSSNLVISEVDDMVSDVSNEDTISNSYTPEHARGVAGAGVCERCGSPLMKDPEGHVGCSNAACRNSVFHRPGVRNFKKYVNKKYYNVDSSAKRGIEKGKVGSRIHGGSAKRNLKGAVNELHQLYPFDPFYREDLKKEGVNARSETNIKSDIDMIKRDAVDNFKAGKTYKEAVKDQIDTYAGYGWWDKKNDANKGILRIQKNEVKEVIWDVYKNPHNHGITWADIDGNEDYQKAYKSTRGALGLKNSIMGKLVSHGVESNKVNMGKIAQLQSRLKELDKEEKRWQNELGNIDPDDENAVSEERKAQAELEVIRAEIQETLRKIEDIEKHPELAKRMYVRGSGWLGGKKDSVKSHSKRAGGWLTKKGKGIRDGKDKAVNGAVNAYSHHKAMIFGWISTICAFIILIILYYMKVLAGSVYIPVSGWQIFIFMLLAILFEVIKTSMDTDAQSRNEAREIITLLAVLALIFTAAIRDPAVGFWTSLIFCAILSLYLLMDFYTNSALVSIVLAIVMMVVISFTAAGWMNELGVQAEKLAIQTGFAEAIETSIGAVSESMADVWLMITDPNGWYAKQEMEQNAQKDESATDRAVEITTTKITPSIVNLGDEVNLLVEVENFGNRDTTKPARDVEISVTKGENHREHFSLEGSEDEVVRYIGDLMSGTGVQEIFEIAAPPAPPAEGACIATFQLDVGVSYGYDVDAVADIFIIGKKRYDELVKQDKFVPEKQVAKSTSGPVSVSLMTNLPQPIPVDVGTQFSIHFGIVNTRSSSGEINASRVEIAIPTDFIPVLNDEEVYENCKLCELVDSDGTIADDSFVYYSLKEMYDGNSDTCSVNADKSLLLGGDIKIFKCVMQYDGKDDISFKKPKDLHVSMDYIYGYTKTVSFTVRKRDIDVEEDIAMCS